MRVAIVGGGLAGVTAAWQLAQIDGGRGAIATTLFEASDRLGGTIETVRRDGFAVECGPDGWVSEKPWARQLAGELGLGSELIESNDAGRVTYILRDGELTAIPDGMRMMVPTDLAALEGSPLFSDAAREAYASEPARADGLRADAPANDESIAEFVRRHFGDEVLRTIGAPLLSGVFGGDVAKLSARAVMPVFVAMEREFGSLISGLQAKARGVAALRGSVPGSGARAIFTSLRSGTETLIERMVAGIADVSIDLSSEVQQIAPDAHGWNVTSSHGSDTFDALMLATPAHVTSQLLAPHSPRMAELTSMEASSAIIVAFAFAEEFALPTGFGFLVPAGESNKLLAGTFVDQKFPARAPAGKRLLRAFFGGSGAAEGEGGSDAELAALALGEFEKILGKLPPPLFSVVRRWPRSLPQYGVGHLERMAELRSLTREQDRLWLLGNGYNGVGLPDLIRDARMAAQELAGQ